MDMLDVRRFPQPRGLKTRYEYRFESSDVEAGAAIQEFSADVNQMVVERFCAELGDLVQFPQQPHDLKSMTPRLRAIGHTLYKVLFPDLQGYLPDLARRLRSSEGLFIRTNEAVVPWETLHDGEEFFGLKYDLGRQYVVRQQVATGRDIGPIRRALLVADPLGDLPGAREEANALGERLRGQGTECAVLTGPQAGLTGVVTELETGTYDLLHFSGHVEVLDDGAEAALTLHDGELLDRGTIEALLHEAALPVVFINGCASAEPLSNLCSSFMTTGSKVVVGALHEVPDRVAHDIAEGFYDRLIGGKQTAGSALRESRRAASERYGAACTSFVLYGNPWAQVEAPQEARRADPPTERPAVPAAPLDADAQALIGHAKELAAPHGMVTSMDLLARLLEVDEEMQRALGPDRLAIVQDLLSVLLETVGGHPVEDDVPLTDTVTKVLVAASEEAARAGRSVVSVKEITEAFLQVGGGTARAVLEGLNLSLNSLRSSGAGEKDDLETGPLDTIPTDGAGTGSPPFDASGVLRVQELDPSTLSALSMARALARVRGEIVGSHTLLLGFMLAGSAVLRDALAAQSPAGDRVIRRFYPDGYPLAATDFSMRCLKSLTRALDASRSAGRHTVDDASLLVALLGEEGSRARVLISRSGIDLQGLQRQLRERS